ncbi:MAG: threonylcarbamoyl-AMP synthase [Ruminococcus sp.]|nr:threonylcarbamoyl-AMP synthase [Ruminococcus sp.]
MTFQTKMLDCSAESIESAARLIKSGEIVGMPTETVYGLAADAFNEAAVEKIFKAKGRPADNPLIVHISDIAMISEAASEIPALALKCAKEFWPGPLTMVLPKNPDIPSVTSGGLDTVGIRMPSHPATKALIEASGTPLAAPSANISGSPSPTCAEHVLNDLNGKIPAVIDGGVCDAGIESTVICFEQNAIKILRPGKITAQMLAQITPDVRLDKGVLHPFDSDKPVASPGMKYKHYSPKAEVIVIDSDADEFFYYVSKQDKSGALCLIFGDENLDGFNLPYISVGATDVQQAHNLFDALRQADERGAKTIYARCPKLDGMGMAVYNRLLRAAAFRVVKL